MRAVRLKYLANCAAFVLALAALSLSGFGQEAGALPDGGQAEAPAAVEVCFVLDTTGSMGGLIAGAKAKIWSIANQLISADPPPRLRIGLIGFRDRGDEYVTKVFDLSEDIDAIYAHLQGFKAAGGGDAPESVNRALHEAVMQMGWSQGRDVLKVVFLVGDSPPHMDYQDDVKYQAICQGAVERDLIINTIQCGGNRRTARVWQEIARLAEGRYAAIGQTGDMKVLSTPMDDRLAELNAELGETIVPYGAAFERRAVRRKQATAEAAAASAVADRLAYNAVTGKVVQGGGDLLDAIREGATSVEALAPHELPEEMSGMSLREQEEYVRQVGERRDRLQAEAKELMKQRRAHIEVEEQRRAKEGGSASFDDEVSEMVREQGKRKGIQYK